MSAVTVPETVPDLGTVLVVFAHPDDETYLAAGLMSAVVDRGERVVAVTATAGDRGTDQPHRWPPDRLRTTREWELAGALAVLGVQEHRLLGFDDGMLDRIPLEHGVRVVRALFEEYRPDTVVTFGRDGVTGHADHCTVAGWVAHAVFRSARPPRLLAATLEAAYCDEFAALHEELSVFMDPSAPHTHSVDELALHLELSGTWLDRKVAALRCQSTQTAPVERAMGEDVFRRWVAVESFVELRPCAAPGCSFSPRVESGAEPDRAAPAPARSPRGSRGPVRDVPIPPPHERGIAGSRCGR
jgi:LmbE family N-acetylglucosaminyl deacetylase